MGRACGAVVAAVLVATSLTLAQSQEDAAQRAAEQWLALVDGAQYAASWDQAAAGFKRAITADQWEQAVTRARQPFGQFKSRKVKSRKYSTTLPGAPDGQYVVVEFESTFEHKAAAIETAVMMLESDGSWRIAGSFIK
jgi:hypothetical protein